MRDPSASGGILDPELRQRADKAILEFQRSYDAVMAQPTSRNLDALREGTDWLMRTGARVLMELNRP
jgi:hypothetical protein